MIDPNKLDRQIEDALRHLRTAQPQAGLEQRAVTRLKQRSATPVSPRTLFAGWPLRFAAAACATLVVTAGALLQRRGTPAHLAIVSAPSSVLLTSHPVDVAAQPATVQVPGSPVKSASKFRPPTKFPPAPMEPPVPASYLPSIAPPSPQLTAQELLLVRMAQQGNPQELHALDPSLRAELDARDRAAFTRFFPRPAPTPSANVVLPPLAAPPINLPPLQPPPLTSSGDAR